MRRAPTDCTNIHPDAPSAVPYSTRVVAQGRSNEYVESELTVQPTGFTSDRCLKFNRGESHLEVYRASIRGSVALSRSNGNRIEEYARSKRSRLQWYEQFRRLSLRTIGELVFTGNSNSDVVMMKTTEHGQRGDVAEKLCTPEVWGVFIQCQVGPDLVIVRSVALQDTTQVRLAEHDDMIETFTS